jgi:tetratricopeptide (TPR) repeat protein
VRHDATVDRILQRVIPGARVQRSILDALLRDQPKPETLVALLAAADPATVRAAVLYLGLYGTVCESAVLALCLHHEDKSVVQLAEHCLWSIWMQSGSEEGNRHLAAAVGCMKTGDHVAAIKVLDGLLAREPEFAEAHFQRGLALAAADQTAEAEDAYRQALRLNPYHFGAAAALGHACVERGHLQAALHFYRQALRIHPQLEDVPDAVHELESALGTHRRNGV